MPAKGTTRVSPRQKAAVARGRLAGKTIPEIAKATGLKPDTAAHVACGPEVKGIINRAMVAKEGKLFGFFEKILESLEADIDPASKLTYDQRERARNQAVTVLQLGQPKAPETPAAGSGAVPGGGVFLGDMLTHYRSVVMGAPSPGGGE